jgi:hypothetical protein
VARIHEVSFYCLTSHSWDYFSAAQDTLLNPENADALMTREQQHYSQSTTPPVFEHPCMPLTKILSSGSFYYAPDPAWDLSSRLPVRLARDRSIAHDIGIFDERFVWNEYIVRSLLNFRERLDSLEREELDKCQFIVRSCPLFPSKTMYNMVNRY